MPRVARTEESRRRPRDDRGTTLVELVVASAVSALLLSALYVTMWGFSDDVATATDLSDVEAATRPVLSSLVIELRQAVPGSEDAGGYPVESLTSSSLQFVSDRFSNYAGPEQFTYTMENCADGFCELHRQVLAADASAVEPNYTYDDGTVVIDTVALIDVAEPGGSVAPLFVGVTYSSGVRVLTTSCDRSGATPCEFTGVGVALSVDPNPLKPSPRLFELTDEVRFRNVP